MSSLFTKEQPHPTHIIHKLLRRWEFFASLKYSFKLKARRPQMHGKGKAPTANARAVPKWKIHQANALYVHDDSDAASRQAGLDTVHRTRMKLDAEHVLSMKAVHQASEGEGCFALTATSSALTHHRTHARYLEDGDYLGDADSAIVMTARRMELHRAKPRVVEHGHKAGGCADEAEEAEHETSGPFGMYVTSGAHQAGRVEPLENFQLKRSGAVRRKPVKSKTEHPSRLFSGKERLNNSAPPLSRSGAVRQKAPRPVTSLGKPFTD